MKAPPLEAVLESLPLGRTDVRGRSGSAGRALPSASADAPAPSQGARAASLALETPEFLGTRPRSRRTSALVRGSVPGIVAVLWLVGPRLGLFSSGLLASPVEVLRALLELVESGQLQEYVAASMYRAGLGVSLGVTLGLLLGVGAGLTAFAEEIIDPMMQMIRAVPFLALIPLFISWFGIDEEFKVVLIATASAFPMYAYSYLGVRSVDRKILEAARGFGLRRGRLVVHVILPAALPNLLMALRICLSISVAALIAAEQVGTTKGIGYLVLLAKQYYRPDYMLLCVLLYATLGLAFDLTIRFLERALLPWRRHTTVRG